MKRYLTGLAVTLAAAVLPAAGASAHWGEDDYMHHMGFGGGIFGLFMMLSVLALIVAVIVLAVRWFGGGSTSRNEQNRAMDILGERFAKGEIDKNEFEERRRALGA
jgi:putative membrane protein